MSRLNHMLFNNQWVNEEMKLEIKKYLDTIAIEIENFKNLQNVAKTVIRGKFLSNMGLLQEQGKSQINNLILH